MGTRTADLLAIMRDPDTPTTYVVDGGRSFTKDGEWFQLNFIPNIGRKTIAELVAAGMIEPDRNGRLYRLVGDELWRRDFGDLWVA